MVRAEMIGIDPVWQRIVLPSTAVLRLGMLLAVAGAEVFHVDVAPAVTGTALSMALLYACGYAAVWAGRLNASVLGATVALDAALAGALVAGAGVYAPLAGFLVLLALAVAHMCGGTRLLALSAVACGLGWLTLRGAGIAGLVSSGIWQPGDFHLALETETSYRGQAVAALTERQVLRAALAAFFLVSVSGCLAFLRAVRERRRVADACSRVDALEAIVDCCTDNAPEPDFWRAVSRGAALFTGARVLVAYAEEGALRFIEAGEAGRTLAAVRVPLEAQENLIVHSIATGREAEAETIGDLLVGSTDLTTTETPRRRRRYLIVPVEGVEAALVAVAEGETTAVIDGLRIVGERAALVRRTWQRLGHDVDFEIAPAGA